MGKFINNNWKVVVNSKDLSDHAFNVQIQDEKDEIDVSGFSPTGIQEFLPGRQVQGATISFLGDFGSASVFNTISPLYEAGSAFPLLLQPDASAGTSATNPVLQGTASVYQRPVGGGLNERAEMVVVFRPASGGGKWAWGTA